MKTAFCVLSLLLATVSLSTANQCQWGPSYWCKDPATAEKCGQLRYCQENVWSPKNKVNKPLGMECTVCELLVDWADKYITSNKTEEEVEDEALKYCGDLPFLADVCKELVTEYFPKLWEYLKNGMDPTKVCTELGLCTSTGVKKLKVDKPQDLACEVCQMVVTFARQFIDTNKTEEEVEEELEKFCSALGGLEAECKSLVKEFFPQIWKYLVEEMDPDKICALIGVCSSATVQKTQAVDIGVCDICKIMVGLADQFIDSNKTEEEAEMELERFCSYLGDLEAECKMMIEEFFPTIWKLIEEETDPDKVCTLLGLCSNATLNKLHVEILKSKKQKDVECDICKDFCNFLQPFVDNNVTKKEVEEFLKAVCAAIPIFQEECNEVLANFNEIWDGLQKEVDGDEICYQLDLCSSKVAMVTPKGDDDFCKLCQYLNGELKAFVDESGSENEVKALLEEFCTSLPSPLNGSCNDALNIYFEIGWDFLKQEIDSGELCALLELCNSSLSIATKAKVAMATPHVKEPEFILCELCELIMEKIDSMLVNNATEQEITELVMKICKLLPSEWEKYCDTFIEEYGEKIIQALVDGYGPKIICTLIGVCLGEESRTTFTFNMKSGGVECEVCETALEFVKEILGESFVKDDVERVLEDVCKLLPSALQDECKAFVDQYSAEIVQLIDDAIDPQKLCEEIKVCPGTSAIATPWKMLRKSSSLH